MRFAVKVYKTQTCFSYTLTYIILILFWAIGLMNSVYQWSGRPGFNSTSSHTKGLRKWYLLLPWLTLNIIR